MEVKLKIYITDDSGTQFMGIGVYWLLKRIDKYGSIRKAAKDMELSYVKALGMLNNLEKHLDVSILERKKGGDSREGTVLTSAGLKLINLYDDYQDKVKHFAGTEFDKIESKLKSLT